MADGKVCKGDVFIADDDASVRNILSLVFSLQGFRATGFAEGLSLLAAIRRGAPTCIILDMRMPGPSGLDVLKELSADGDAAPILIISGHGDIPTAVSAIRHGAFDFIEKPFDARSVVTRAEDAIKSWRRRRDHDGVAHVRAAEEGVAKVAVAHFPGSELLTEREQEVLAQVAAGASSKEAGRLLGISFRTIEVHRAHIMDKLGAKNTADLVRLVLSEARHH